MRPIHYLPIVAFALVILGSATSADARCCYERYQRRAVVYTTYPPARVYLPPRWSAGMHLTGMSMNHAVNKEGLALAGVGAHLRFRHYRWGAEIAVDMLGNNFADGGIRRVSVPVQTSAMLYLVPYGRFNVYLLAGLRLVPSNVQWDLPNLTTSQNFVEFGGQVGVGAELLLTRRFGLTADLRGFGTVRNDHDDAGKFYEGLDEGLATPVPGKSAGLQLSLGASLRF